MWNTPGLGDVSSEGYPVVSVKVDIQRVYWHLMRPSAEITTPRYLLLRGTLLRKPSATKLPFRGFGSRRQFER